MAKDIYQKLALHLDNLPGGIDQQDTLFYHRIYQADLQGKWSAFRFP